MIRWTGLFIVVSLLVAACAPPAVPIRKFVKGDELAYYDFTEPGVFEEGTYGDGAARLQISDGVYRMVVTEGDSEVWYGQWGDAYDNVVIDVEARQITEDPNTVYGLICRMRGSVGQNLPEGDPLVEAAEATPEAEATMEATAEAAAESTPEAIESAAQINNGDGYLFLVEGAGRFAIMRARGRSVVPLVDWTSSDKIKTGAALNTLRAVCLDDYLALYVNGEFVGDAIDDTYNRGQVGLAAAAASRLGLTVEYDNLTVSQARAG
ncbi:MAG: hypothetical protein HXY41_05440 [Chloroflexi bacterium]|nr:hypothetical protein [Chloroflexota bacterium]